MFKFIVLTLFMVGATVATVADGAGYDETADIVEMAFEAADAADNAVADDSNEDMGYVYSDGDLEDNINIAVNAAILDKYGKAATSERTTTATTPTSTSTSGNEVAAKSANVQSIGKLNKKEKSVKRLPALQSNRVDKAVRKADYSVNSVDNARKAVKTSRPVQTPRSENTDTITRFVSQVNADGTYGFDFEQASGLAFKEVGHGGQFAQGSYQYVSPEGEHISVTYNADENGFHPESDILPTPPPIPSYILKALEFIREHPTAEELADREVRAKQI